MEVKDDGTDFYIRVGKEFDRKYVGGVTVCAGWDRTCSVILTRDEMVKIRDKLTEAIVFLDEKMKE